MKQLRYVLSASIMVAALFGFLFVNDASAKRDPMKVIIDTDTGVDDAAALAWMLSQNTYPVEILGISTVAGNTTVENATNNVLTVLDAAGRDDIPVIIGADAPRSQPLSKTGSLLHGPDGFWFSSIPHDQSSLSTDVPAFFRDQALANPGAKLITLGPLTNVAAAIEQYPSEMALYGEIVILGGSKTMKTPRADFNMWQDTEASDIVLNSGLPITLITVEAGEQLTIDGNDIEKLANSSDPLAQLLAFPLQLYAGVASLDGLDAPLYDVAAVMYAVRPRWARDEAMSLVKIVKDEGLAFGQTIMGSDFGEVIPMIASDAELSALADRAFTEPGFDLETELFMLFVSEPMNAKTVFRIRDNTMERRFMRDLR